MKTPSSRLAVAASIVLAGAVGFVVLNWFPHFLGLAGNADLPGEPAAVQPCIVHTPGGPLQIAATDASRRYFLEMLSNFTGIPTREGARRQELLLRIYESPLYMVTVPGEDGATTERELSFQLYPPMLIEQVETLPFGLEFKRRVSFGGDDPPQELVEDFEKVIAAGE